MKKLLLCLFAQLSLATLLATSVAALVIAIDTNSQIDDLEDQLVSP